MPRPKRATHSDAGKLGGAETLRKYGPEFYREIGRKGGQATHKRHGNEHFEQMGRRGGQRVRELIARGREDEEQNRSSTA